MNCFVYYVQILILCPLLRFVDPFKVIIDGCLNCVQCFITQICNEMPLSNKLYFVKVVLIIFKPNIFGHESMFVFIKVFE